MRTTATECPDHSTWKHMLACAHAGKRQVWLTDQGSSFLIFVIDDIERRRRANAGGLPDWGTQTFRRDSRDEADAVFRRCVDEMLGLGSDATP